MAVTRPRMSLARIRSGSPSWREDVVRSAGGVLKPPQTIDEYGEARGINSTGCVVGSALKDLLLVGVLQRDSNKPPADLNETDPDAIREHCSLSEAIPPLTGSAWGLLAGARLRGGHAPFRVSYLLG
jgi:hypothetical protein